MNRCIGPLASGAGSSRRRLQLLRGDRTSDVELGDQGREFGGNVVIALDHGRHIAELPHGVSIEVPHFGRHRRVMGVDDVRPVVLVSGEMDLPDSVLRDAR